MADIIIARWAKYGHDRGYATTADGAKLGWIDLKTGAVTLELGMADAPGHADPAAVTSALMAWAASNGVPAGQALTHQSAVVDPVAVAPAAAPPSTPAPPPTAQAEPAWHDLAEHRPGQLVREQAISEWEAAKQARPIASRLARVLNVHTDERAWRVGADGEEAVGARLEKLRGNGWHVLHSVPVGEQGSDIDHVLVGPGGVFTINTKNHPGGKIWVAKYQMRVNGQPVPYLRNARFEAQRTSKLLTKATGFDVVARSCVVVLTGTFIPDVTYNDMPDDVMVLDRMDLPGWFKKRPVVLDPEQVEAIYQVARRSDTWTRTGGVSGGGD